MPKDGVQTRSAASAEFSAEEAQQIMEQLAQKERRIREQEQQNELRRQEIEFAIQEREQRFNQEREDFLHERLQLIKEQEKLRDTVHDLVAEIKELRSRPSGSDHTAYRPLQNETPARTEGADTETTPGPSRLPMEGEALNLGIHKRVKEAADGIQTFDGSRQNVMPFCESCFRARDYLLPGDEPLLVRTILNKLRGPAYRIIGRSHFNTVNEFCDKIRKLFSPFRSANYYRGELSRTFQTPNQSVLDFAIRIQELRDLILDGDRQRYGTLDTRAQLEIQKEALEAFVQGLLPDIATRLRIEGFDSLDDAIERAIRLHTDIQDEQSRFKRGHPGSYNNRDPKFRNYDNVNRNQTPDRNQDGRQRQYPPKSGGYQSNDNRNGSRNNNEYRQNNRSYDNSRKPPDKTCRYCKTPGHTIDECRKLQARKEFEKNQAPTGNSHGPSSDRAGPGPSHPNRGAYIVVKKSEKEKPRTDTTPKQEDKKQEEVPPEEEGLLDALFEQ